MRAPAPWPIVLALTTACLPENPVVDDAGETDAGTETGGSTVESGLLGCPSGERCTIVAVSQTIDDRVDLFTAAGSGATYRGALDLDLKQNPGGDISGQNLDEPYGLVWSDDALRVLVGHYPTRDVGSLVRFDAASLAGYEQGAWVPVSDWFSGATTPTLRNLERTEPLSMLVHEASGSLVIAVFANDLMLPESMWTEPSELLAFAPGADEPLVADAGCAGAWSIVALDAGADTVALACDGDESVVIVDATPLSDGQAPSPTCTAEIPFSNKRVRYLAPDGLGGVVVVEHPPIVSASEDARMWWYDGNCQMRGFSVLDGDTSWATRELVRVPGAAPRWLLSRIDGDARGILIMAGDLDSGEVTQCGRLDALDDAGLWAAEGGTAPLAPHALALNRDGDGLAIGVAPSDYDSAGPGWGSVWWTGLDYGDEPCDAVAVDVVELGAAAPSVDPNVPQTWRRAPDVVDVIEVQG